MYGERIKEVREDEYLTQREFAAILGIGQPYLSKIESEQRGLSVELIIKICTYFKVTADYLLGMSDQ